MSARKDTARCADLTQTFQPQKTHIHQTYQLSKEILLRTKRWKLQSGATFSISQASIGTRVCLTKSCLNTCWVPRKKATTNNLFSGSLQTIISACNRWFQRKYKLLCHKQKSHSMFEAKKRQNGEKNKNQHQNGDAER